MWFEMNSYHDSIVFPHKGTTKNVYVQEKEIFLLPQATFFTITSRIKVPSKVQLFCGICKCFNHFIFIHPSCRLLLVSGALQHIYGRSMGFRWIRFRFRSPQATQPLEHMQSPYREQRRHLTTHPLSILRKGCVNSIE